MNDFRYGAGADPAFIVLILNRDNIAFVVRAQGPGFGLGIFFPGSATTIGIIADFHFECLKTATQSQIY
ncbi:MAG: hypothetical protein COT73_08690 [Bdellovibrio sp. CG10_big_fil_rev_8_21_14_0_10_47_8]|nr:MAG: hypothetical protein COT73_08690 [Bdellovibrio sp. CG10_big_fil_rev_8_21_14_0_10_47_8]